MVAGVPPRPLNPGWPTPRKLRRARPHPPVFWKAGIVATPSEIAAERWQFLALLPPSSRDRSTDASAGRVSGRRRAASPGVTNFDVGQIPRGVEVLSERHARRAALRDAHGGANDRATHRTLATSEEKSEFQAAGISVCCFGVLEEEKAGCLISLNYLGVDGFGRR